MNDSVKPAPLNPATVWLARRVVGTQRRASGHLIKFVVPAVFSLVFAARRDDLLSLTVRLSFQHSSVRLTYPRERNEKPISVRSVFQGEEESRSFASSWLLTAPIKIYNSHHRLKVRQGATRLRQSFRASTEGRVQEPFRPARIDSGPSAVNLQARAGGERPRQRCVYGWGRFLLGAEKHRGRLNHENRKTPISKPAANDQRPKVQAVTMRARIRRS
jgi:hypothetical protein